MNTSSPSSTQQFPTSADSAPQQSPRDWRRQQRTQLLERRLAAGGPLRRTWNQAIEPLLRELLPEAPDTVFGMYWPFKGEFAIRPLMRELHKRGGHPALPVVARAREPLEFHRWHPGVTMVRSVYNIPVPEDTPRVRPDVLVVPLVGFDAAGYRLGYGGGYYDRTINALQPHPLLIGVGYEMSRLDTIHPQPHDIPMDYIVTEAGVSDCR